MRDELLQQVRQEALALGIPIAGDIAPAVVVNTRAKTRFGRCIKRGSRYTIELSVRVTEVWAMRQILAHEVLHTCYGCGNHGKRWKGYADRMNAAYGYQIQTTSHPETLGVSPVTTRYRVRCQACGREFARMKRSALITHPERYRCKCGGHLQKTEDYNQRAIDEQKK